MSRTSTNKYAPQPVRPEQTKTETTVPNSGNALTDLQKLLCDEAADIIANGPVSRAQEIVCTNLLLTALAHHRASKYMNSIYGESGDHNDSISTIGLRDAAHWEIEMKAEWQRNRKAEPEQKAEPTSACARVRAFTLDVLRSKFEMFAADGTPEEIRFMDQVMELRQSNSTLGDLDHAGIIDACDTVMTGGYSEFIRVPREHQDAMLAHLQLLRKAQKCEAA